MRPVTRCWSTPRCAKSDRSSADPDTLIDALTDAVGPEGTILGYCDWQLQDDVRDNPELRDDIPPFDPLRSRSIRDNGAFPEMLRTTPGAKRSGSPGGSMAALGGRADWFTADHALDYGYGPQSPLGKLVEARGKTLLLGAPRETMTLLHHAEHLADIPGKRVIRYDIPLLIDGKTVWHTVEEFDTSEPDGRWPRRRLLRDHRHRVPRDRPRPHRDGWQRRLRACRRRRDRAVRGRVAREPLP